MKKILRAVARELTEQSEVEVGPVHKYGVRVEAGKADVTRSRIFVGLRSVWNFGGEFLELQNFRV